MNQPRRAPWRVPRPLLAVWGSLLAVALGSPAAGARPLALVLTPELPTWHDVVRLRVAGEVVTSCGPGIMHLSNVRPSTGAAPGLTVDVDLVEDPCGILAPPVVVPFAVELDLGKLLPGDTDVRVHDLADGEVVEASVLVHEVSRLGLDLPAVAVSGAPVALGVTHLETCFLLDHEVAGSVIELVYDGNCPILPPGPRVNRTAVEVGPLAPGDYEVRLLDATYGFGINPAPSLQRRTLRVWDAAGCVPADDRLCLQRGRFRVSGRWRAFDGKTGVAHAAPLAGNEGSGLLWFFAPDNTELTVKLIQGCGYNGRWWAFVSSSSTVEYEVTVTDTATGASRTYANQLGQVPRLIADTSAFGCP